MQREITIHLEGQPNAYRLHEDAYGALSRYLDRSRARLASDPDQAEVMADLERSIGAKLTEALGGVDRLLTLQDVNTVLDAIGPVGPVGIADDQKAGGPDRPRRRRLYRIREGQWIAGVCTGLALYSEIRVDWVRSLFVIGSLFSAGLLIVVYVVLAFLLPIADSPEAWLAQMRSEEGT
jgi:phage shock protein C